jgi:membrane-associated phospholipid phosphatase
MAFGKMVFYDWFGGNELLFKALNGDNGQLYASFMTYVSRLSDYKNFPIYFILLVFCAFLDFGVRKLKKRGGANHALVAWFGALLVLIFAFGADTIAVKSIQHHSDMPRPYVVLAPDEMTLLEFRTDPQEDYQSFPSGHVSFITILVTALWPVLSSGMRQFGVFFLTLTCISQVAVGMHFPVDVLAAFLLAITIGFLIRWILYSLLLRFNVKC